MKKATRKPLETRRNVPPLWENTDGPRGAGHTIEGLTHSSVATREGLGVKPTRTVGGVAA